MLIFYFCLGLLWVIPAYFCIFYSFGYTKLEFKDVGIKGYVIGFITAIIPIINLLMIGLFKEDYDRARSRKKQNSASTTHSVQSIYEFDVYLKQNEKFRDWLLNTITTAKMLDYNVDISLWVNKEKAATSKVNRFFQKKEKEIISIHIKTPSSFIEFGINFYEPKKMGSYFFNGEKTTILSSEQELICSQVDKLMQE